MIFQSRRIVPRELIATIGNFEISPENNVQIKCSSIIVLDQLIEYLQNMTIPKKARFPDLLLLANYHDLPDLTKTVCETLKTLKRTDQLQVFELWLPALLRSIDELSCTDKRSSVKSSVQSWSDEVG